MSTSPHDLGWIKTKKVISSSPFYDGGYPSDRIAGKGVQDWEFYGTEKDMGSVVFRRAVLGQLSKVIQAIDMHFTPLRSSRPLDGIL